MATKMVELPCGFETHGRLERSCEISKLKGRVQRDVAKLANKKKPDNFAVIQAILNPSVVQVGDEPATNTILGPMLLADRDWLLFEIVKFTRGPLVTIRDICPECDAKGEWPGFNLDELEVTELETGKSAWWDGDRVWEPTEIAQMSGEERIRLKYRVFTISDEDLGVEATFRYPNGLHQQAIMKMGDNEVEALWKLMSMTLLSWRGADIEIEKAPKGGVKTRFWEDMDMDILDWAQSSYADAMPGVNSRAKLDCPSCEEEFTSVIRAADFLFRTPQKAGAKS